MALLPLPLLSFQVVTVEPLSVMEADEVSLASSHSCSPLIVGSTGPVGVVFVAVSWSLVPPAG